MDLRQGIDRVVDKTLKPRVKGISWKTPSGYRQALYEDDYYSREDFEKEIEDFKKNKIDYDEIYDDDSTHKPNQRLKGFSFKNNNGHKQAFYVNDYYDVKDFLNELQEFKDNGIEVEEIYDEE